ncbi:MAG: NAD(P)H-dependent oxidoreductase [Deinococcota bacterium]
MNVLVILGHPTPESLCGSLATRYGERADAAGANVQTLVLADLEFDAARTVRYGYERELEPDLLRAQEAITWADHLVFVYPTWWALMPALLKGFLDRTFLPGFAFAYQKSKPFPLKLLKGKTARLLVTMDSPSWWFNLIVGRPGHNAMKRGVLQFCGVSPVKITSFNTVRTSSDAKRQGWLEQAANLAANDLQRFAKPQSETSAKEQVAS